MEEPTIVPASETSTLETLNPSTPEGFKLLADKAQEINFERIRLNEEQKKIQKICPHRNPNGEVLLRRKKCRRKGSALPLWQCTLCKTITEKAADLLPLPLASS